MDFIPDSENLRSTLVITGTLVFFYFYYYGAHSAVLKSWAKRNSSEIEGELQFFLLKKLTGFVFLGILPAIVYFIFLQGSFGQFGFNFGKLVKNLPVIAVLVIIIVTLLYFRHKKNPRQNTLQIKSAKWTGSLFLLNITGWAFYLLAYEFLFRGILLFECFESFGFWPAVAINITIYSAIHMVNGKDQAIGALFFGSIASYLTLTGGTVLIPLFMHIALSGFSDYFSIKMNPDIGFSKSNPVKSDKL